MFIRSSLPREKLSCGWAELSSRLSLFVEGARNFENGVGRLLDTRLDNVDVRERCYRCISRDAIT